MAQRRGAKNKDGSSASQFVSIETERLLLGLLMERPINLQTCSLAERHFSTPTFRVLFRGLVSVAMESPERTIQPEVLYERVRTDTTYPLTLDDVLDCGQAAEGKVYTRALETLLIDLHGRRIIEGAIQQLKQQLTETETEPRELLALAFTHVEAELQSGDGQGLTELGAVVRELIPMVRDRAPGDHSGLRTGFDDIDHRLGGLPWGEVTVLGARPSAGKSSLAQQIEENVAWRGLRVLSVSPEMSRTQKGMRYLSRHSGVELMALRTGHMDVDQRSRVNEVQTPGGAIYVLDDGAITSSRMVAVAQRLASFGRLDLIVIDHLQFLAADDDVKGENRNTQIGYAMKNVKYIARKLDCPVLALSQLSRHSARSGGRPNLQDLRDSGDIEQDADTVVFLHRPSMFDDEEDPTLAEFIIGKARNGATGRPVRLNWTKETASFSTRTEEPPAKEAIVDESQGRLLA